MKKKETKNEQRKWKKKEANGNNLKNEHSKWMKQNLRNKENILFSIIIFPQITAGYFIADISA
jgi:hypothetical protein